MKLILCLTLGLGLALSLPFPAAAEYEIGRGVIASGGADIGDTTYTLRGTVGQCAIGVVENAAYTNEIGFWYQSFWAFVGIGEPTPMLPTEFWLGPNRPNPFNPRTTFTFALPEPSRVQVRLYDAAGRLVRTLVDEHVPAGYHNAVLEARGLSSGVYYCRMTAGGYQEARTITLVK